MLESLDLRRSLPVEQYKLAELDLKTELARLQQQVADLKMGLVVVIEGWGFAGKSRLLQWLAEPLDPRRFKVHVMYPPSAEEQRYPFARRYLVNMPPRGEIAFFLRSWYYHVLDERVQGGRAALEPSVALEEIRRLEQTLTDEGYLIVKFWLHIDRDTYQKRRKKFQRGEYRAWLEGPDDPKQHKHWDEYTRAAEEMLAVSSTEIAPWYPVSAVDKRYLRVRAAKTLIRRVEQEAKSREVTTQPPAAHELVEHDEYLSSISGPAVSLAEVDLTASLERPEYTRRLKAAQGELIDLHYKCVQARRPVVFVFEGWDAAGKGGVIRRMTCVLDPRHYNVHSVAAPRGDEIDHHYMWRFWQPLPPAGEWAIFDRSWYGRVLVERVEGFCTEEQWRRAYGEINDFEAALHDSGYIMLKYWMQISKDEQLRRFEERQRIEYKRFKITDEDWRNRDKWDLYEAAVQDMFDRTSTNIAPWTIIAAEQKWYGRVQVLETAVQRISDALPKTQSPLRRQF